MAVDERAENQTVPEADNRITLYSLQGEVIQEVEAFYLSCLGDLAVVSRTGGTDLYRRSDGSLVAEGLAGAYFVGDDLLYTETEYGGPVTVYDSTGTVAVENVELQINYNNHVWQGHGYLSVMDGKQRGLLDSSGQWALEPRPWYIYAISHGYALCRDETSFYAVSLTDGEVAFESPYGICAAYSQGLLLELDAASFDYGWVMPGDDAPRPICGLGRHGVGRGPADAGHRRRIRRHGGAAEESATAISAASTVPTGPCSGKSTTAWGRSR